MRYILKEESIELVSADQSSTRHWMDLTNRGTARRAIYGFTRTASRSTSGPRSMLSSCPSGSGSSSSVLALWPTSGLSWSRTCMTRHRGKLSPGALSYLAKPTRCSKNEFNGGRVPGALCYLDFPSPACQDSDPNMGIWP